MRINVYSQELLTDDPSGHQAVELVTKRSTAGIVYSAVRLFLHSSERLHHPPQDDDRSAITIWLPKSPQRRVAVAESLRRLADLIHSAPAEDEMVPPK